MPDLQLRHPGSLLLIGNFLSSQTGVRSVSEDLAERLAKRGWHISTRSNQTGRVRRLADILDGCIRLRRQYQAASLEVYSGPAFVWAETAAWVLRRLRKPYLLALHGGGLPVFARRWPGRVRRLVRSACRVVTPSRYIQTEFLSWRPDLLYIPNGIDVHRYPFRDRQPPLTRLSWLRAFHEIYNPAMAVKSLARLVGDFPDLRLTMIGPDKGDGSLQSALRLADELGLRQRIEITGAVPKSDIPLLLQSGDVFLNTTRLESFGVSVMEAAACGLCVVTTNAGELPHLWADGEDALLVSRDNDEAMANAVRRILCEPGLAGRLSTNGRAKAERFDWEYIIPQWEDVFKDLVRR